MKIVECKTDEEVKTLCADLTLAQKWRIGQLQLPHNIGAGGWEALGKVTAKGKVGNVLVSEVGLTSASDQQIEALWGITEMDGVWLDHEDEVLGQKRDGHDGLQMLLAIRLSLKCDISDISEMSDPSDSGDDSDTFE